MEFLGEYFAELSRLGSDVPVPNSLEAELAKVEYLQLVSHLGWAAWSLPQAMKSTIDFDYIEYAAMRIARFEETVEEATRNVLEVITVS